MFHHSYPAAEKFILSREFFGMKLGLENIKEFLTSIGSPQTDYKTIHIAGTNGKGSSAAMLEAVLRSQGYKTGLFTSPHLVTFRERIRVNGKKIHQSSVVSFIDNYRKILSQKKISFFELLTALAFEYFSRTNVEIAVIETGLGGRLDASNVLNPLLTITTDISYDHMEILGKSLPKIAGEKAGIIKENTPHLIGLLPDAAEKVIRKKCLQKKAPLYRLRKNDFKINPEKMTLDYRSNGLIIKKLTPSLIGKHQLRNSALVLKALLLLKKRGLSISIKSIVKGISQTNWPGRFQIKKYRSKPTHIFDVSHNTAGVKAFVESYNFIYPYRKAHIITGFVKRKEHRKIFNSLSTIACNFALVPLRTGRSTDTNELISNINFNGVPYKRYGSLKTAYSQLLNKCTGNDIIIIIGSHFLVGEFFERFKI